MNKYFFPKKIFEDIEEHIELFCEKKTDDGYRVRGQVFALPELNILPDEDSGDMEIQYSDESGEKIKDYKIYFVTILVLTNDNYQKKLEKEIKLKRTFNTIFGFLGNNVFEFSSFRRYYRKPHNSPVLIDKSLIKLEDYAFIINKERQKKDLILLDIDFDILSTDSEPSSQSDSSKKIFPFLVERFSDYTAKEGITFAEYFINSVHKTLYDFFDYRCISRYKYNEILTTIGNLGYEWINKKETETQFFQNLNNFRIKYEPDPDPLIRFCYGFFEDLVDEIVTDKDIKRCQFCGDFFPIDSKRKNKIYCSLEFEGKDCGKKARDKKYYMKQKAKSLN